MDIDRLTTLLNRIGWPTWLERDPWSGEECPFRLTRDDHGGEVVFMREVGYEKHGWEFESCLTNHEAVALIEKHLRDLLNARTGEVWYEGIDKLVEVCETTMLTGVGC